MSRDFVLLNLGCGIRTSPLARNIDWSIYLRLANNRLLQFLAAPMLSATRRQRLRSLRGLSIQAHDLARGIPADAQSVDMVYHSHLLEHLDRDAAIAFLAESHRVLRPGGIVRIVVPDLELIVRRYVGSLEAAQSDPVAAATHDESIAAIYEQSVRREGVGTTHQPAFIRLVERVLLGDARRKGETHQWMYDRVSLRTKLEAVGFCEVTLHSFDTSGYPRWNEIGLDREGAGAYKPGSLYIEAIRPG